MPDSFPKRVYRKADRTLGDLKELPPRAMWPYALPGAAWYYTRRWERLVARAPVMTAEEHARAVGLKDIEEVIGCDLCGERRMRALLNPSNPAKNWSYHVVLCVNCGFMYRHPGIKPERLGELYGHGKYSDFLEGKYLKKRRRRYKLVMKAFDPLFRGGDDRRLFDFGCGTGLFLDIAHERGFDCYGVDLAEDAIKRAREKPSGQNTYYGQPHEHPEIAAGGFDIVTLWSVLAHLATPIEDFKMLRGLMKDDGALLVLTVNANSMELKAQEAKWNGYTKNHLKIFSPTTLPRLLKLAGFEAVTFRHHYGDTVEAGTTSLSERQQKRLRRVVEDGNQGNMMRAVAWASADAPAKFGLDSVRL